MALGPRAQAATAQPPPNSYVFFAQETINSDKNRVVALFADITLDAAIQGNVYTLFSQVRIKDGARVAGRIFALSSGVYDAHEGADIVVIPLYIFRLGLVLTGLLLCFGAFGAFRAFVSQGGVLLGAEPAKAIRNGILTYFLTLALVVLLSLTIVLLPIALLFLLAALVLIVFGQASLALLIGLAISRRLARSFPPGFCLFMGLAIVAVISNIPVISVGINYIFMPILAMGIAVTCIINGFVKKKFYYAPFKPDRPKSFDRKAVRGIILGEKKD